MYAIKDSSGRILGLSRTKALAYRSSRTANHAGSSVVEPGPAERVARLMSDQESSVSSERPNHAGGRQPSRPQLAALRAFIEHFDAEAARGNLADGGAFVTSWYPSIGTVRYTTLLALERMGFLERTKTNVSRHSISRFSPFGRQRLGTRSVEEVSWWAKPTDAARLL